MTPKNDDRSGKRRRPRDEAYFGYCTVEDLDTMSFGKSSKQNPQLLKALDQ